MNYWLFLLLMMFLASAFVVNLTSLLRSERPTTAKQIWWTIIGGMCLGSMLTLSTLHAGQIR